MNLRKNTLLFALGGGGYVGLELLYRGRSHYSMFLAGGVCFLLLGRLRRTALPAAVRACLGAGAITAVEPGHRAAGEPGLPGLGLPAAAGEFSGSGLPPVHPAVDPPGLGRHGAVPPGGAAGKRSKREAS